MTITRLDRITGCLLGGAIGDALGAPVEFLSMASIVKEYGSRGIQRFESGEGHGRGYLGGVDGWPAGTVTDDTQMTLFTIEGMLDALQFYGGSVASIVTEVHAALVRWYDTQTDRPNRLSYSSISLASDERLWHCRAPGTTCMESLSHVECFGRAPDPINDSKGNGAVMKTAPVGLLAPLIGDDAAVFQCAAQIAYLTHQHPTAWVAAGAQSVMIAALCRGESPQRALEATLQLIKKEAVYGDCREVVIALLRARMPGRRVAELGQGWIAEEALAIGVYCLLNATSFRHGVLLAVNHDGDSDTTGAIAGNLLGARLGRQAIDQKLVAGVELSDLLLGFGKKIEEVIDAR